MDSKARGKKVGLHIIVSGEENTVMIHKLYNICNGIE